MNHRILAAMALACVVPSVVFAADAAPAANQVTIPWGDWLGQMLTAAATIVVSLIGWTVHRFAPPAIAAFITNDAIERAVNYAIATTRDAARGQTASLTVTNELLATAARWVIANEPRVAEWAGDNLRPLIVARLAAAGVVPAEASSANLRLSQPANGAAS